MLAPVLDWMEEQTSLFAFALGQALISFCYAQLLRIYRF